MKPYLKIFDKWSVSLVLLMIVIVRLPSFSFIPGLEIIRSHMVLKGLMIMVFIALYLQPVVRKVWTSSLSVKILLVYFFVRSISVFNSIDPAAYFTGYQRFLFGFMGFFIAVIVGKKKNFGIAAIWTIVLTSFVNTIADLNIYFFPSQTLQFFQQVIHPSTYKVIEADANRNRIFFNQFNEISVVFVAYYLIHLIRTRPAFKLFQGCFISVFAVLLLAVGIISGWRIRIADYMFALLSTIGIYFSTVRAKALGVILSLCAVLVVLLVSLWSISTQSSNIFDRIGRDIGPRYQNTQTTNTRIMLWKRSIDVGLMYPLTGVGFDNFIYYMDDQKSKYYTMSLLQSKNYLSFLVLQSPHNIFFTHLAESGFLGFFVFLVIILFFFKKDIELLLHHRKSNNLSVVWILQFWTLMVFGLFHPTDSTEYYLLFFFIRGMIESYETA